MVSHIFRFTGMGGIPPRVAHSAPAPTSPHPPRGAARDLLLHHHRLAELSPGDIALLVHPRDHHRSFNRLQAPRRRHEMGTKAFLEHTRVVRRFYTKHVQVYQINY